MFVEHHGFTIEYGCRNGKRPGCLLDKWKSISPVMAAPRDDLYFAGMHMHSQSITVPLDLIGPFGAFWRLCLQQSKVGLDPVRH